MATAAVATAAAEIQAGATAETALTARAEVALITHRQERQIRHKIADFRQIQRILAKTPRKIQLKSPQKRPSKCKVKPMK